LIYGFRLADSQYWGVQPGKGTGEWADALARLLGIDLLPDLTDNVIRLERLPQPTGPDDESCAFSGGRIKDGCFVRMSPYLEIRRHPSVREIVCGLHETADFSQVKEQMRCALFPVYDLTVRRGGLPLHCALVERDGLGILLVGRSGVGKSTACRRLPKGWSPLCDDLALVVRMSGGGFAAHPLPTWSAVGPDPENRRWDINRGVRLAAIFFLAQSAEDEILPAGTAMASVVLTDAAMTIFRSVRVQEQSLEKKLLGRNAFANAAALARSVPSHILRLSLTGRFWEKIEEILVREKGTLPLPAGHGERYEQTG
jgi:SynChlorMet cassette protein ScmC